MSEIHSTQTAEDILQQTSTLLQRFIERLVQGDIEGWLALWDDDCTYEFPYAPQGYPQCIEGKAALREYVKDLPDNIVYHAFPEQRLHFTLNPLVVIAELKCDAHMVKTGKPYNMSYVQIFENRNGKILSIREYWNTLVALEAMGGLDAFKAAFNISDQ